MNDVLIIALISLFFYLFAVQLCFLYTHRLYLCEFYLTYHNGTSVSIDMVINPILLGLLGLTTTTYALLAESASTWTVNRVLAQAVDGQASLAFTIDVGLPPKSPWPSTKSCVRDWDKFIDPGVALPTTWSPCHTDVWVAWRFLPGAEVELNFPYDFKVQVAFWDQKG
jgi:hypothetical protein